MRCFEVTGLSLAIAAVVAFLSSPAAADGDPLAGRKKAQMCAACHGLDGVSKIAEAPNLAGQNEMYLIAQLTGFQSGARSNEMMNIVVKTLSEDDIANLAAYYSSIEINIGKIPGQ